MYFEACVHAATADDAGDAGRPQHPMCSMVSMHPRYACNFLKPPSPLEVRRSSLFVDTLLRAA
jgi:hypothetical protein